MGCQRAQKLNQERKLNKNSIDDSGQLSIDFLVGISIFIIGLIIATTIISSLLIGLQAKKIDFDAVAYRTGVILAEDPGEPNTQFNYLTITEEDQWEFIGFDQKDKVRRFGLTLYKSTPRVFSEQKITSFFNRERFPQLLEYRNRIIAGDYPYNFNVSLKVIGGDPNYVGDTYDPNSTYGYIRRVVLVKNETRAEIDMNLFYVTVTPDTGNFLVNLPYGALLNQTRGPQYWIEPPKEDIVINLTNVGNIRNQDQLDNVILKNIQMTFDGRLLDGTEVSGVNLPYRSFSADIDGIEYQYEWPWGVGGPPGTPVEVQESINITFPAGYFIPPSAYADITLIRMTVRYEFEPTTVNLSSAYNYYEYIPDHPESPGFTPPELTPAILEVRVW